MSSFTFIPRSVKKKTAPSAASSNLLGPSVSGTQQREVSSTTPVAQTSALARSRSEHVASTGQTASSETRTGTVNSKGRSRDLNPPGYPGGDDGRQAGVTGSNVNPAKSTATKVPDLKEVAGLVCLALSDYQIWADTALRRKIDWGPDDFTTHNDDAESSGHTPADDSNGYLPLDYLVHHSPVFFQPSTVHPETLLVKAIRTHAAEYLDVRLVLAPEESTQPNKWSKKNEMQAGYQVRRRTPPVEKQKSKWDNLTIYLENIPAHLRSLPGVLRLIAGLLHSASTNSLSRVQSITFPAHHRDRSGSIPTCKGFALVILAYENDVQHMLDSYPWETTPDGSSTPTTPMPTTSELSEEVSDIRRNAHKFGLRTLSKSRWEELKAEYLSYRQQLVDEINQYQEIEAPHKQMQQSLKAGTPRDPTSASYIVRKEEAMSISMPAANHPAKATQNDATLAIHANSPFPSGCLIFVRNVNMETNKTTLRALFSQFTKNVSTSQMVSDGIDYVDYMKGMDNCHLRLSTPAHAEWLLAYFAEHPVSQMSGLDGVGKQISADSGPSSGPAITLELVLGKREQVYWEKVPEKVRRQAVEKSLQIMHGAPATKGDDDLGRKLKRRKRG